MTDTNELSELDILKQRADDMGIEYSPRIGVDALREKVNAKLTTAPEVAESKFSAHRNEALKLVRVIITNLNPSKKEYEAEYFRAGNSVIPTVSRLVPFEVETHVEQILLNHIKTRKYAFVKTFRKDGKDVSERLLRNEFQVEVLPALTKEELENLATEQSKRQSV